jgi:hypothetical protein
MVDMKNRIFFSFEQMLVFCGVFIAGALVVSIACMAHRTVLMREIILRGEKDGDKEEVAWESRDYEGRKSYDSALTLKE